MAVNSAQGRLVVFRGNDGKVHALDARCPHLGADLSAGRVSGNSIECAYHHFRFDGTGRCAGANLAARAFAVTERFGGVFLFVGERPVFEFPVFSDAPQLVSARPLQWNIDTDWFMVGANAFDARHFRAAHDRQLTRQPVLAQPHDLAMHVSYEYAIEGTSLTDRLVRFASGRRVLFEVTSWAGNVLLVRAAFERDVSYGLVIVQPGDGAKRGCMVTVIVNAARAKGMAAFFVDALRLFAKRLAIRNLLLEDLRSLEGLRYLHEGLRPGDEILADYLNWVRSAADRCGSILPI